MNSNCQTLARHLFLDEILSKISATAAPPGSLIGFTGMLCFPLTSPASPPLSVRKP